MTRAQAEAACAGRQVVTWDSREGPRKVRILAMATDRAVVVRLDEHGRRYFVPFEKLHQDAAAGAAQEK